jgi:hypothetical protein
MEVITVVLKNLPVQPFASKKVKGIENFLLKVPIPAVLDTEGG